MKTKEELLEAFHELKNKGVDNHDCDSCDNCNYCNNCILCRGLRNKNDGYYVLNEKVTKEEFERVKELMK